MHTSIRFVTPIFEVTHIQNQTVLSQSQIVQWPNCKVSTLTMSDRETAINSQCHVSCSDSTDLTKPHVDPAITDSTTTEPTYDFPLSQAAR